jgi:hypothetical protein
MSIMILKINKIIFPDKKYLPLNYNITQEPEYW